MAETEWYKTERNTEALVKAVVSRRPIAMLSGEDIWYLMQLTWITAGRDKVTEDHWKRIKIPALAHLFRKTAKRSGELKESVDHLHLHRVVAGAAAKKTGFVNTYRAYRNSLLPWCKEHESLIRSILETATTLTSNDQDRFSLASRIAALPRVSTPNNQRTMAASSHITPLVACLDPKRRFPIINGESGVNKRLARLGLAQSNLEEQVRGFIGLIGQFGLGDSFAVDTMTDAQIRRITQRAKRQPLKPAKKEGKVTGVPLPDFDEAERIAVQESATIVYRQRHNRMTTRLKRLLPNFEIQQGTLDNCRYDALICDYDGNGRDLLIEAKPDANKGAIRIAIGQLLDYRRFLTNQPATDLAILTISPPSESHVELMHDLQITALWFKDEHCLELTGAGKSWKTLEALLRGIDG